MSSTFMASSALDGWFLISERKKKIEKKEKKIEEEERGKKRGERKERRPTTFSKP